MSLVTRRQFIQQTALTSTALFGCPKNLDAQAKGVERSATPLDPAAIRKLTSDIVGHVITPDGSEYEAARLIFNRAFDRRPAVIVCCAGPSDVARTGRLLEHCPKSSLVARAHRRYRVSK